MADTGEKRTLRRLVLELDIEQRYLDASDDTNGSDEGITVESVAAWLCSKHDPKDGYIRYTVSASGSPEGGAT